MDQQRIETIIQFLTENQARFHTDLELLKERMQELAERTDARIRALAEQTDARIQTLAESQQQTDARIQTLIEEMREGFDNLIVANEVTRDLATKVGQLTMQNPQRIARLEDRNGQQ